MKMRHYLMLAAVVLATLLAFSNEQEPVEAQGTAVPQVNVPYTSATENSPGGIAGTERAIFWFGKVGPTTDNYADVRIIHNDEKLHVTVHVIDRLLYYQKDPATNEMPNWDAVSLYLDMDGTPGAAPAATAYKFVGQVSWNEDRSTGAYDAAYQGNGSSWTAVTIPFETVTGWQGQGFNNQSRDHGWNITFRIPYSSLGLNGRPASGTQWKIALVVHDNDGGSAIPDKTWPPAMTDISPATWANLVFGLPTYTPPAGVSAAGTTTIRHGLNGAVVTDGHVGGDTTCAANIDPNFWSLWGSQNYANDYEVNVQNQWNLGDFPCFSKYYVTFPLDQIPANKAILNATLILQQFGNSNQGGSYPGDPPDSLIQVLTVQDSWQESTITWNNAPLAVENVARTWVYPLPPGPPYPNVPREWDLSYAVAQAYEAGQSELKLVLYSADSSLHSGKYFRSSESNDPSARPTLTVTWGDNDGFTLVPDSPVAHVGGSGGHLFTIDVARTGAFNSTVSTAVSNPSPSEVSVQVSGGTLTPPGQIQVTLTDLHPANFTGSRIYVVPVQVSGGGVTQSVELVLVVNGEQVFLPVVVRQ